MKITIKHNIKREGCILSGQILDCQFLDGAERDDRVYYYDKNEKRHLISCGYSPELWGNTLFVWAKGKERDLNMLSYTYTTEQEAQAMLDFINTFVEKEGTVQSEPKEKRYMLIEVGGRCCQALTNDNICVLDGDCDNCPHGKTLEQIQEEVKKLQEAQ